MNRFSRAAVYIRVSTKKQAEKFGLIYQENEAKSLIENNKWSFTKVYEDRGISGLSGPDKRLGLQYLLEDAQENVFDKVVIFSVDRLGRSQDVVNQIYEELNDNNIGIVSCTENLNTKEEITFLVERAHIELKIITNRQMLGKKERIKLDGECGGNLPYGYIRIDGKVSTDPYNSQIVNNIFDAYFIRKLSTKKIAISLTKEKIPAPKGVKWYSQTIYKIIANKNKYNGGSRNGSKVTWPVILINKYPDKRK